MLIAMLAEAGLKELGRRAAMQQVMELPPVLEGRRNLVACGHRQQT
jgi:hypothetical protein